MKINFLFIFIAAAVLGYNSENYGASVTTEQALKMAVTSTGPATVASLKDFVGQQLWYMPPEGTPTGRFIKGDIRQVVSNSVEGLNLRVYEGVQHRPTSDFWFDLVDPAVGLESTRGRFFDVSRELALRWQCGRRLASATPVAGSTRIHPTRDTYLLGSAALLTIAWYYQDSIQRGIRILWKKLPRPPCSSMVQ